MRNNVIFNQLTGNDLRVNEDTKHEVTQFVNYSSNVIGVKITGSIN